MVRTAVAALSVTALLAACASSAPEPDVVVVRDPPPASATAAPSSSEAPRHVAGPSDEPPLDPKGCEAAKAAYEKTFRDEGREVPSMDPGNMMMALNKGSYLAACGVPVETTVHICAAIQNGVAVGVTIMTRPKDAAMESCIRAQVRGMGFPSTPLMKFGKTTFAGQ